MKQFLSRLMTSVSIFDELTYVARRGWSRGARVAGVAAALWLLAQGAQAQSWTGGAISTATNYNWSDGTNWSGGAAPTSSSTVVFPDGAWPVTTNVQGVVNNIVQSSTTIATLTYDNAPNDFNTTEIPNGVTLTVNGNITVGPGSLATVAAMTGGGTLIGGSGASTFQVTSSSGSAQLDMSGLNTFVFNPAGTGGTINISTSAGGGGSVNLASSSNFLTASTLNIANDNTANTGVLNLGNGTNIIYANTINMGISKGNGTMQFLGNNGGGLTIANTAGTGRATILLGGEGSSGGTTTVNTGKMLFNGGTVNILAGTITMANRTTRSEASALGVLSFTSGVVDATTIIMGTNESGGAAPNAYLTNGGGILRIGAGGLSMANDAGAAGTAVLDVTGGGSVICSNNIFKLTSTGTAIITMDDATLTMASTTGTIGVNNAQGNATGNPIDMLDITNAVLTVPVQSGAEIECSTFNPDVTNTINVSSLPAITTQPTPSTPFQTPIISYSTAGGNLNSIGLGTLPGVFQGFISNNVNNLSIDIVITNGPAAKTDEWGGNVNNVWDTVTPNWTNNGVSVTYLDLDFVTFDDLGKTANVTISGTRLPGSLTFANNVLNYTLSGSGSISGNTSLEVTGTATVRLAETGGDNFKGGVMVNSGTVILDEPTSSITGGLTIQDGATAQIGYNDGNGALPGGAVDDEGTLAFDRTNNLTVSTAIPGGGGLSQIGTGTLTLTAANTYTGTTTVSNGTLALSGSGSVSTSQSVVITNGTLDISAAGAMTLQSISMGNGTINLSVGYQQTNLTVGNLNLNGTSNVINVHSLPAIAYYPATVTLVNVTGSINGTDVQLGSLPAANPAYGGALAINGQQIQLTLTSGPIGSRPSVTWSGNDYLAAVSTNWSDAQNWTTPGAPTSNEPVSFTGTASVSGTVFDTPGDGLNGVQNPANLDNIVDQNFAVRSLTFANASTCHNTLIAPGKSLSIGGSLTVSGAGGVATIYGTNGALLMSNPSNTTILEVANASSPTLDLSGLDTFNASVAQMIVGYSGNDSGATAHGTIYLAKTNVITTGSGFSGLGATLVVGGVNSQGASGVGSMYLGQSNALFVDGIVLGVGQDTAGGSLLTFNPALGTNPVLYVRGVSGSSSRVTQWSLGDDSVNLNNNSYGSGFVNDFTAGTINALVNTMIVGQGCHGNETTAAGTVIGQFNMGAGLLDVTTLDIGAAGIGAGNGIGIMNVTGGTVVADTLTLASTGGGGGLGGTTGMLDLTNATLELDNGIAVGAATGGGTLNETASLIELLNGTIGSAAVPLAALGLNGGTLQLYVNGNLGSADVISGNITTNGTTTIDISSITNITPPVQLPLISYTGVDPFGGLALGTTPPGYVVSLVDNTGNSSVDVSISVPTPQPMPTVTLIHVSGTTLTLQATNGASGGQYVLLSTTNLALPTSKWSPVLTNNFDVNGNLDLSTNVVNPAVPQEFYLLSEPQF